MRISREEGGYEDDDEFAAIGEWAVTEVSAGHPTNSTAAVATAAVTVEWRWRAVAAEGGGGGDARRTVPGRMGEEWSTKEAVRLLIQRPSLQVLEMEGLFVWRHILFFWSCIYLQVHS